MTGTAAGADGSGPPDIDGVRAVTLDFYGTLVYPGAGRGRGEVLMEYLREQRLEPDAWEHQVLYDVFERHGAEYSPELPAGERRRYRQRLAERVLRRLGVADPATRAPAHADRIWEILGPGCLRVYPEVPGVLRELSGRGLPLAVLSNWQHGLRHFCAELGLLGWLEHVVVSAEVGSAKPAPGIFHEACRRLGRPPEDILHVGDQVVDDVQGGRRAGLQVLLVRRPEPAVPAIEPAPPDAGEEAVPGPDVPSVPDLEALPELLA